MRQPQPATRPLPLRYFQPLPTPDSLDAIVTDQPAGRPESRRDASIPIPAILARQRDNRLRQRPFVVAMRGAVALRAAPLTEQSTRLPLRQSMALLRGRHRLATSVGAQECPWATSRRICFSRDSSATTRFSREFSFSSSFSRFAWASFSPPYSFRQR